tara:strand:+ start:87 stop:2000 length:1914 start_codon:yes stop_codon:yes gene_type:complete
MNNNREVSKITPEYRPEIDSLRAIAVSLVVLFHFDVLFLKGGFVGVDIFFVISGYLITKILWTDIKLKRLNLVSFYLKRIRRIIPALSIVILFSLLIGYLLFSPEHLVRLSKSSLFSSLSIANIFFWSESDYFDFEKHFKPLLHTWSLSVEIQFYIFWSLLIYFFKSSLKKHLKIIVFTIFLMSLTASFIYSGRASGFFYFTGFRLYEFALGAFIFLHKFDTKKYADYLFISGLFIILGSALLFTERTIYPGLNALLPCIGAFLVLISFNDINYFKNIFINKYIIHVGKLSYSIYLLHWPILIFYKYYILNPISNIEKFFLIILTLCASSFLYRFIELPFRKFKNNKPIIKNHILLLFLTTFFIIVVITLKITENLKLNNFLSEENTKILRELNKGKEEMIRIEDEAIKKIKNNNYFINSKKAKKVLIIGDSHASDFYVAMLNTNKFVGFDFEYLINNDLNCFKKQNFKDNILNEVKSFFNLFNYCQNKIAIFNNQRAFEKAEIIIVSSRWESLIDFKKLNNLFNITGDKKIIYINRRPKFYHIPTLYLKSKNTINETININKDMSINIFNRQMQKIFKELDVQLFDIEELVCPKNKCYAFKNEKLLYSDEDHWSLYGAKYYGEKIYNSKFLEMIKN